MAVVLDAPVRIEDLGPHDHACWVFTPDEAHHSRLTSYLMSGLDRQERVTFFGSPPERVSEVASRLSDAGVPVNELVASGQLMLGSAQEQYLRDGRFDPQRRLGGYAAAVRAAVEEGFRGLRLAAEVAWVIAHRPSGHQMWPGYEFGADLLAAELPFTALCMYDARQWQAPELALVESVHSVSLRDAPVEVDTGFRLQAQPDGSIRLQGEVDAAYAARVAEVLEVAVNHARLPVFDLAGLEFIDIGGMRAIARACQGMVRRHGEARIVGASPLFRRVWHLAEFDRIDSITLTEQR